MLISIKRIYDTPAPDDGVRILVDRLWPRGISKAKADLTVWMKDIAPSHELREWFGHDPAKWEEFQKRYIAELKANTVEVQQLKELIRKKDVTLLYGARDEAHNQAVVLRNFLKDSL